MNQEMRSKLLGSTRVSLGSTTLLDRKAVEVLFGGTNPCTQAQSIGTSGPAHGNWVPWVKRQVPKHLQEHRRALDEARGEKGNDRS
jgi:hypothetical protein